MKKVSDDITAIINEKNRVMRINWKLLKAMNHITAACGNPDSSEACRTILKIVADSINDVSLTEADCDQQ